MWTLATTVCARIFKWVYIAFVYIVMMHSASCCMLHARKHCDTLWALRHKVVDTHARHLVIFGELVCMEFRASGAVCALTAQLLLIGVQGVLQVTPLFIQQEDVLFIS